MAQSATHPSRPVISVARDSKEGMELLRRRLVLFWGVVEVLCFVGFVPTQIVGVVALGRSVSTQLGHLGVQAQLASLVIVGAIWLYWRFGNPSRRALEQLDGVATVAFCLGGALMTYYAPGAALPELDVGDGPSAGTSMALLANVAIFIMRAALVPSTALRTLGVSLAATLPLVVVSLLIQRQHATPVGTSFAAMTIVIGLLVIPFPVVISAVIYRLQRQVSEAKQLGQYTLDAKIGEGGMGIVYRARHALLRRPTAIKLLQPERAGEQGLARFEREVQQTSRLSHPNTVAIYDFGHTDDGLFYYAMEYLDGLSLDELVAHDGPQPPGRVVHVLRQACGALAEAHGAGLIHRDVKPANLHLCNRGGIADHLKVLDFGLVKELTRAPADPALSMAGNVLGTPHYMAPETIGRPEAIDGRADIYALGAVAYFLLTGTPPFQAGTMLEICSQHLHVDPEPPSRRLGSPVPAALEALVLRCLAKSPDARPASATELSRAFAACADVAAWTEDDAGRWWQQRAGVVLEQCALRRAQASGSRDKTIAVNLQERL